jgi:hypothetical protein
MNEVKISDFHLPISPYLDNSTTWWIETFCPENSISRFDISDKGQQRLRDDYHQWMRDQGVIVREIDKPISDDTHILFIDDQSMLVFSLRWGN